MAVYGPDNAATIDSPANGILLRADVYLCLANHGFIFYPNPDNAQNFIAYFVRRGFSDFPDLFHRRQVTIHSEISIQYLYARFAYAIINLPRDNDSFDSIQESGDRKWKDVDESEEEEKPAKKTTAMAQGTQATPSTVKDEDDGGSLCRSAFTS